MATTEAIGSILAGGREGKMEIQGYIIKVHESAQRA